MMNNQCIALKPPNKTKIFSHTWLWKINRRVTQDGINYSTRNLICDAISYGAMNSNNGKNV